MIKLTYDAGTGLAKLAQPAVIKNAGDVRVQVVFTTAPGEGTTLELTLLSDAAPPATLAFTDDFTSENSTTWTALLDATDTRLADHMTGKASAQVSAELRVLIDGELQVAPNVAITVQAARSGPAGSEGGPEYYTTAETEAVFAAKTVAGKYRFKTDGTFQLWNATQSKWHTLSIAGAAGAEVLSIAGGED